MNTQIKVTSRFKFYPLTKENWKDFEKLFGKNGACAGCWCMYWRTRRKDFVALKGEGNKKAIKRIVNNGTVPGIIAYADDEPVGWCSVSPRSDFPVLANSRILKPVDDKPVWSVVCFFIKKDFRKIGLSTELLQAASEYVKSKKGKIIEGYPIEPKQNKMPDVFAWTGFTSAFLNAGFKEIERRSETRPIMRKFLT